MANATANLKKQETLGGPPFTYDLPVDGGSRIYASTLVSQLTATGCLVPYSTAASGVCVGVSQHESDNTSGADGATRCRVESMRGFALKNGTAGDAFSEASLIGSPVYASDDSTVADNSASATRKCIGSFLGMETDGKVRVFIDPRFAAIVNTLQTLTDAPATADALRDNIVAAFG